MDTLVGLEGRPHPLFHQSPHPAHALFPAPGCQHSALYQSQSTLQQGAPDLIQARAFQGAAGEHRRWTCRIAAR